MKWIVVTLGLVLVSCGSNKKLSETTKDKTETKTESLTKIDTTKSIIFRDSMTINTQLTIREYELVEYKDTIVTYVKREITQNEQKEAKSERENKELGTTTDATKKEEKKDIKTTKEEEKEIYDPSWPKYIFFSLLLLAIGGVVVWLKTKTGIIDKIFKL